MGHFLSFSGQVQKGQKNVHFVTVPNWTPTLERTRKEEKMSWYLQSGTDSDVVISTRIRFARNLAGFRFHLETKEEKQALENKIKESLFNIGYGLKMLPLSNMDDITKMSLVEKNLISPEFALKHEEGSIIINDEENICIMIGDEDHLRIQVFSSGFDLNNTLNYAIELDQKLEEVLTYATSEKYGYLTAYPNNCGTGLKASVMVHLPALLATGNIRQVMDAMSHFEINIRGIYGNNSQSTGDMFQISNQKTLGVTEKEIIESIQVITEKIVEQERKARKFLAQNNIELEDQIYRNYGILTNARKISYEETRNLLSMIKVGTDLGILPELTDSKVQKLYLYTKPANMQKWLGKQYDPIDREIKRAEVIQKIIQEK